MNDQPNTGKPPSTALSSLAFSVYRLAFIIVLLFALGLRLLLWSQPLHEPANDEIEYLAVARDLLAGRGWVFYDSYRWLRAPLYPLFLAGSLWLAGGTGPADSTDVLHRAALPNVLLSTANVALAYWLAKKLVGPAAALLAALFTAVLWTNATFASLYMAETLFTFLFQAGLLALLYVARDEGRGTRDGTSIRWPLVVLAGVLFGLATLTRSITLLFLPVLALWLVVGPSVFGLRSSVFGLWSVVKHRWPAPLVFLAAAALVIAPWTVRNARAYGEPILVETGLSYNLWAFNEPRESLSEIHGTLEAIPNPAVRADYATARGVERLREDPVILARKVWPNWVFLARVKPIQDRFLLSSYYATVELPLFVAALVFDDLLYVVIVLAAIAALVRRPHWLVLAWIGYCVLTMLLTHGEARYRHFLFPVLIPFAAAFFNSPELKQWRKEFLRGLRPQTPPVKEWGKGFLRGLRPQTPAMEQENQERGRRPQIPLMLVFSALFLWTVLTSYPWDWAGWNTARSWYTLAGDTRWAFGDRGGALELYERAIGAHDVPDAWLQLGQARRAAGDLPGAAEAYRRAWRREPLYYPASTWYGDALRELGAQDEARRAFAGSFADSGRVTEYAWRALNPAPRTGLDVGDGLDYGYVRGVYPAEQLDGATARWTDGRALLRLAGKPGQRVLRLRLAAPWPDTSNGPVDVCVARVCQSIEVNVAWRTYELPIVSSGGTFTVELRSGTFVAQDGRVLGVLVDWAAIE